MRQQATALSSTQPWHLQFQLRWSSSLPLTLCLDYNSSFLTSEAGPSKAGELLSGSPGMVILGTWSPNCEEAQASHTGWLHVGVVTNRLTEVCTHREHQLQMWVFTCFLLPPQDTLALSPPADFPLLSFLKVDNKNGALELFYGAMRTKGDVTWRG